jgi:hypothetical protein
VKWGFKNPENVCTLFVAGGKQVISEQNAQILYVNAQS